MIDPIADSKPTHWSLNHLVQSSQFVRFALRVLGFAVLIAAIFVFVLWPVAMVFDAAWQGRGNSEPALSLAHHRASLASQTFMLIVLTLAVALPVGVFVALAIFRCNVPGRAVWAFLVLLPALIPLELHATAWLATLGPQGLARAVGFPVELKGLIGAAWIHAMAALPWVVGLVGAAISIVEAELEEDCLLLVGPIRTMWHVTLRRSAGAIIAAGLLVAVFTAGEMAVTDLLQVRTYAETVYTEFAIAGRVGAATATALPGIAVWLASVAVAGWLAIRKVPQDTQALFARRPVFQLRALRWPVAVACGLVVLASLGIPAGSLIWRAGLKFPRRTVQVSISPSVEQANPQAIESEPAASDIGPRWSAASFAENLLNSSRSVGDQLLLSLTIALATAAVAVPVAWLLAAIARHNRLGQWVAASIVCLLFALPGPVLGIGLELALGRGITFLDAHSGRVSNSVGQLLREIADKPAVLVWLHSLRTLPFAVAIIWPVLRLVNRSLLESAAVDGAGAWERFRYVEFPACRGALVAAALACAVLSIGELGGSVIVTPPGEQPLSVRIFSLAHFGLENHLAGICLVLLGVAAVGSLAVLMTLRWAIRSLRE